MVLFPKSHFSIVSLHIQSVCQWNQSLGLTLVILTETTTKQAGQPSFFNCNHLNHKKVFLMAIRHPMDNLPIFPIPGGWSEMCKRHYSHHDSHVLRRICNCIIHVLTNNCLLQRHLWQDASRPAANEGGVAAYRDVPRSQGTQLAELTGKQAHAHALSHYCGTKTEDQELKYDFKKCLRITHPNNAPGLILDDEGNEEPEETW